MQTTTHASVKVGNLNDTNYTRFLGDFVAAAWLVEGPLFTTDAANLWDTYLSAFEGDAKQHHTCHACRKFIETYGGLVTISMDGKTTPFLWRNLESLVDGDLEHAFGLLYDVVRKAKVTGIFYSSLKEWGSPITGVWRHMSVKNPNVFKHAVMTPFQAMAEKRTEYATVSRALNEFSLAQLDEAVRILEADALDRTEKVLGQAKWFRDLKAGSHKNRNVVWLAVGTAPSGFCHPRSSMISTLLDDLAAGLPFATVASRWAAKMHPLAYQRPQAAPKAGAIAAAESVVAKMGAAGSLGRRYALLAEVPVRLWTPTSPATAQPVEGRVFGRLQAKVDTPDPVVLPERSFTWEKFAREILPTAERLEFHVPMRSANYGVFTTAVNPDAPSLFQWDNPLAWYVWVGGSRPESFGLRGASWVDVMAVTEKPPHMEDSSQFEHHRRGIMLVLAGARDTKNKGSAIFPECLKAEFHSVRSVFEAFSSTDKVQECGEGQRAQGLILEKGESWSALVRVTTKGKSALYRLDRWD